MLLGAGALTRGDGAAIASLAAKAALELGVVKDGWNGFCVLHSAASRVGALDLGFVPGQGGLTARQMAASGTLDIVFLLGADEIDIAPGAFVVYIGTHGDRGAARADVVLAGRGLSGKIGDLRQYRGPCADGDAGFIPARRCPRGLGDPARAVRRARNTSCPIDSLAALRQALYKTHPHLLRVGQIAPADTAAMQKLASAWRHCRQGAVRRVDGRFLLHQSDRACSAVMAECSAIAQGRTAMTAAE